MKTLGEFHKEQIIAASRKARRQAKAKTLWPGYRAEIDYMGIKVAPRRAKRPPTARQRLIAQLDVLWALAVKKRDRRLYGPNCRVCGWRPGTTAFHLVPKQRGFAIRWELENGVLSCAPCNGSEFWNRSLYQDVRLPAIFGKEFMDRLKAKATTIIKFSMPDLLEIRDKFQKELGVELT